MSEMEKALKWSKGEMHLNGNVYRFDKASNFLTYEQWILEKYKEDQAQRLRSKE